MPALLSLDTSTDACSLAYRSGGNTAACHKLLPRAHNRHILAMLDEVIEGQSLTAIEGIICGVGPGSFTGLRVATGVAQGLAWSLNVPVIPFCSLMSQALAVHYENEAKEGYLLSTIEAQTGQFYWRLFDCREGAFHPVSEPSLGVSEYLVAKVAECGAHSLHIVGSAATLVRHLLDSTLPQQTEVSPVVRPRASAALQYVCENPGLCPSLAAEALQPLYVQTDIGWKKLAEQPRRA
ncbi:MAG: tRNA (adenosine(37)-N6)-threonylcarbamoyltransferase complex dimerization subunit type 1 TsaB [Luminiphilus sp.]|nr:tRNA (adenosine(37)-N6)-threonylcarbamoyltransferase complex dimerization subunit type 1 TsaB [Luminiphilus sp.]